MLPLNPEFCTYITRQLPDLAPTLLETLQTTPPAISLRLNPRKPAHTQLPVTAGASPVPWWRHGLYLTQRPDFTHDPALHQGLYYVQDASSMIMAYIVEHLSTSITETAPHYPIRYLDACAAPGGKTTAAIDALPHGSLVVANEFDFRRAEILKENVLKWGYPSTVVSRGDTARFRNLPAWFDIVAADVPCSGEGMMRKDQTARTQWTPRLVEECASRQREILDNLWQTLRPGGWMIYSTCTFNTVENEDNVTWLIHTKNARPISISLPPHTGIITSPRGEMRFLPGHVEGEGLFITVLQKPDDAGSPTPPSSKKQRHTTGRKALSNPLAVAPALLAQCAAWLNGNFRLKCDGDTVYAYPALLDELFTTLQHNLDLIHHGVELGTLKGRSIIPAQSIALSSALNLQAFPSVEVDLQSALAYLRRESLPGFDAPRGHLLLQYRQQPLGFVNNLGNRANNLYPAPWRILH